MFSKMTILATKWSFERTLIGLCWIVMALITPTEAAISFKAAKAEGVQRHIQLDGNVTLEHELGMLSSSSVVLEPTPGLEGMRNPRVIMENGVKIDWWDGATLKSERASFDFSVLKGQFHGVRDRVSYVRPNANRNLVLTGKNMDFALGRVENTLSLETIDVVGDVALEDEGAFRVEADHAAYKKLESDSKGDASLHNQKAQIDFFRQNEGEVCLTTTPHGDTMRARTIKLLLPERLIIAEDVEGDTGTDLHYTCQRLFWDSCLGQLKMQREVVVDHEIYGVVTCGGTMILNRYRSNGEWKIGQVIGDGVTKMHYIADPNAVHDLTCYGNVTIHYDECLTTLHSPKQASGEVLESEQLLFEDAFGKIYADKAKIEYGIQQSKPHLKKLILCGNVRLHNNYNQPQEMVQQYALADIVEYFPESKQMRFSSLEPGHRVLFFDRLNSLQMSAPRLTITREPHEGKDILHGEGDVRFLFHEKEIEQFRHRFQMSTSDLSK